MSGIDAAFLHGETASWHMHVSAVLIADPSEHPGGFDVEELKVRTAARLHLAPQFRWRLVEVPLGLGRPGWIEDPDFDIDYHVRRIGVPPPGGPEQLGNLIGELVGLKLDRDRPLWEFWVIEGLEGGKVAILAKIHHAIIDGVSGSELASVLLDLEPDAPLPEPPDEPRTVDRIPSGWELAAEGVLHTLATPYRATRFLDQTVRQALRFADLRGRDNDSPVPFSAPRTSFNGQLTPHRRFAYTSVPLADVRALKDAHGVKVNDVVLALCSGMLRRYLDERGELPEVPLVAQVPVSMRSDADRTDVGTKVGAMFTTLATDVEDPLERLRTIAEGTRNAKELREAMSADRIMGISEVAPPAMISLAARMYTAAGLDTAAPPVMNLIISNVPGPPFPIYVAGARIESLYPMGPLLYGTGINVTLFSYCDSVDFGVMVCRDLVPEPWSLTRALEASMDELMAASRSGTPT